MGQAGVVGVGGMGGGVAERLRDLGWKLALWNRSAPPLERFADQPDITIASSPAETTAAGLVISFVANDAALEAVTNGEDGILSGLPEDGVHISMSSVSPTLTARLAESHRGRLVAAPVFGRPKAAAKGLLWIAVAGPEAAVTKALPLLEAVSRSIDRFGEAPETALKVKLAGNFLIASAIEAMSEAFAVLEASGADPRAFHEMMSESIFGSVIHQNYGRIILDEAFTPPGFKLALGGKDVGLALDMANNVGRSMPFGEILRKRFQAAVEAGHGEEDWNAISRLVRS